MAIYCDFEHNNSDVYLHSTIGNHFYCTRCKLNVGTEHVDLIDFNHAIDHLKAHKDAGHHVPDSAMERLECDRMI